MRSTTVSAALAASPRPHGRGTRAGAAACFFPAPPTRPLEGGSGGDGGRAMGAAARCGHHGGCQRRARPERRQGARRGAAARWGGVGGCAVLRPWHARQRHVHHLFLRLQELAHRGLILAMGLGSESRHFGSGIHQLSLGCRGCGAGGVEAEPRHVPWPDYRGCAGRDPQSLRHRRKPEPRRIAHAPSTSQADFGTARAAASASEASVEDPRGAISDRCTACPLSQSRASVTSRPLSPRPSSSDRISTSRPDLRGRTHARGNPKNLARQLRQDPGRSDLEETAHPGIVQRLDLRHPIHRFRHLRLELARYPRGGVGICRAAARRDHRAVRRIEPCRVHGGGELRRGLGHQGRMKRTADGQHADARARGLQCPRGCGYGLGRARDHGLIGGVAVCDDDIGVRGDQRRDHFCRGGDGAHAAGCSTCHCHAARTKAQRSSRPIAPAA